jgi:hypothetical protein
MHPVSLAAPPERTKPISRQKPLARAKFCKVRTLGLWAPLSSLAIAACVVAMRAATSFCVNLERERISASVTASCFVLLSVWLRRFGHAISKAGAVTQLY